MPNERMQIYKKIAKPIREIVRIEDERISSTQHVLSIK